MGEDQETLESAESVALSKDLDLEESSDENLIHPYKCENQYCKDFGKVFKFASHKERHER